MAYRIVYDAERMPKEQGSGFRRFCFTTAFFISFFWLVFTFWPEGTEILKSLLYPVDPEKTIEAAEVFSQELGQGLSLRDAARNFCAAVLEHGYPG